MDKVQKSSLENGGESSQSGSDVWNFNLSIVSIPFQMCVFGSTAASRHYLFISFDFWGLSSRAQIRRAVREPRASPAPSTAAGLRRSPPSDPSKRWRRSRKLSSPSSPLIAPPSAPKSKPPIGSPTRHTTSSSRTHETFAGRHLCSCTSTRRVARHLRVFFFSWCVVDSFNGSPGCSHSNPCLRLPSRCFEN